MKFLCTFRDQQVVLDDNALPTAIDFNGHYLVEIDDSLKPTGRAIDGYGAKLLFNNDELIIEEVRWILFH